MRETDVLIFGSGFSGIGAALRLTDVGRTDFIVLEQADEVGGTWRDNTYPGAACDVQSHLYSLSFAPNPDWSHSYSGWAEILDYLRRTAEPVRDHIRLNTEVGAATWDESDQRWTVQTSGDTYRARVIIDGRGFLQIPKIAAIDGVDDFAGVSMHSARWNHDVDLTGKNVAVIGTGASAVQIVPAIAGTVAQLTVYQRSAPWTFPRMNMRIGPVRRALFRHVPGARAAQRVALFALQESLVGASFWRYGRPLAKVAERIHALRLRHHIKDPQLVEALTPDYPIGCKRSLRTDDWLPTFARDNVELVTSGIDHISPSGVVDTAGTERPADVIVYCTGFHTTDLFAFKDVTGRDGRHLSDLRDEEFKAQIHGYPNYFLLVGPNTNQGYTSSIISIEADIERTLVLLDELDARGAGAVEPTAEAQREFNARIQKKLQTMVWSTGGCRSWYVDEAGVNRSIWPGSLVGYRRHMRQYDPDELIWHPTTV